MTGKKRVLAVLAGAAFAVFLPALALAKSIWDFPEPVTPVAHETNEVSVLFMRLVMTMYATVFAIFIYSVFAHRKSQGAKPATFTGPRTTLQWLGVLSPFALLLFIDYVVLGIPAYHAAVAMEDTKTNVEMVIKVTGSQWKWQYEYPDEGIKFVSALATTQDQIQNKAAKGANYLLEVDNPLVLPTNKKIRILLTATDVMHSWWMPSFGVKRLAVPGYLREMWVKIEKPGTYRGQCAQICGDGHAFMPIVVEALPEDKYKEWIAARKAERVAAETAAGKVMAKEDLMDKGKAVYNKVCAACHQPDGKGVPGAFPALAGSKLVNGPFLDKDGRLIKDGHLDRVMNGKPGTAMQAFKGTLSDVEIAAVVTYERNAFGNRMGDTVQPTQVKALR